MEYTHKQMEYIDSVEGDAHQSAVRIIGELQAELTEARKKPEPTEFRENAEAILWAGRNTNQSVVKELVNTLLAEIDRLAQTCKEYSATINRMDKKAEQMDVNYGRMVLERDRLTAELAEALKTARSRLYRHYADIY